MVLLQDKTIFLHTGHKVSSEDNNTAKEYHAIFRTKDHKRQHNTQTYISWLL